jgi:putative PIN family toxin of toxin-antitoxin system
MKYAVNKPIVVIDTQLILRAAINSNSLPAKLLRQVLTDCVLVSSPTVREEAKDVLTRPALRSKFPQITDEITIAMLAMLDDAVQVELPEIPSVSRDAKDDKFIALAVNANAQFLVSEDKDLLVLDPHGDIRIVDAFQFYRILSQE